MARKYCKEALSFAAAMVSIALLADAKAAKAAKRFATGGEVTSFHYVTNGVGYTAFLHTFTDTATAAVFRNTSGKTLPVRLLVVGGGGAGMDGLKGRPSKWVYGGGGGGGGGVTETNAFVSVGDVWTIRVGAGGGIPNHGYDKARGVAGASSVSNGVVELVLTPGGGAGGSRVVRPTVGAAGGGGSGETGAECAGTNGVYTSTTFISEGVANPWGGTAWYKSYGGGGGGAGASVNGKNGGVGLVSDITGSNVYYGSGGGGGGICRDTTFAAGGDGGDVNAAKGGTGDETSITKASNPPANTGSGGAGGISFGGDAYSAFDDTYAYGTSGADGVVIIRYDIPDTPCVGGDVVTVTTNGFRVTYIHKFTNTTEAATFKPSVAFDGTSVRLLAVGGGGAGMDGLHGKPSTVQSGGGGGGGGGVTETNALLSVGDVWTIHVGAGGSITNHAYYGTLPRARGEASASSVSNGIVELVLTPGGGAGGSRSIPPTPGAAGGGGSGKDTSQLNGADGEYSSSIAGVVPEGAPFAGGKGAKNTYGGGGGGAGSAGKAATGGEGLSSDITGVSVVYGSGGGGGGCFRVDQGSNKVGGDGGENAGSGGTGVLADGNLTITPAATVASPVANTGSGGGGGVSFGGSTNDGDLADELAWGTSGADGVVIIRYEVEIPRPNGIMIIFR